MKKPDQTDRSDKRLPHHVRAFKLPGGKFRIVSATLRRIAEINQEIEREHYIHAHRPESTD